ncbi:MAG: asparaginase [Eubacteriales bacterium]|nr:asparaginase [Eubacteriales bacterium]MDD4323712.1 asparaginase [Eubacteriales bacterium]MDD4542098.1 asparaginase [Eubacteriales bacterium]
MRFLLLNTGGTISSVSMSTGKRPELTSADLLRQVQPVNSKYTVEAIDVLQRDSTDIGPQEWRQLAQHIVDLDRREDYDGYLILHGTDTMAYTAAALSFLLRDFPKTVFLTGAQRAADEADFDGIDNIGSAIVAALEMSAVYSGVFLVFAEEVIHGCHAVKTDTQAFKAFSSIGAPLVAEVKEQRLTSVNSLWHEALTKRKQATQRLYDLNEKHFLIDPLDPHVMVIQMTPGLDPIVLPQLARGDWPLRALILEGFGSGGIPVTPRDFYPYLKSLISDGVFVILGTQVLSKGDDLERYEVGQRTKGLGLVAQGGLTTEAALAKTMWILPQARDRAMLAALYQEEFAFEFPG